MKKLFCFTMVCFLIAGLFAIQAFAAEEYYTYAPKNDIDAIAAANPAPLFEAKSVTGEHYIQLVPRADENGKYLDQYIRFTDLATQLPQEAGAAEYHFIALRYKTNAANADKAVRIQLRMMTSESKKGWAAVCDNLTADGEWHTIVFDWSQAQMMEIVEDVNLDMTGSWRIARIDIFNDGGADFRSDDNRDELVYGEESFIYIDSMAFFKTAEAAAEYTGLPAQAVTEPAPTQPVETNTQTSDAGITAGLFTAFAVLAAACLKRKAAAR